MEEFIYFCVLMLLLAFLCSVPYLIKRRNEEIAHKFEMEEHYCPIKKTTRL